MCVVQQNQKTNENKKRTFGRVSASVHAEFFDLAGRGGALPRPGSKPRCKESKTKENKNRTSSTVRTPDIGEVCLVGCVIGVIVHFEHLLPILHIHHGRRAALVVAASGSTRWRPLCGRVLVDCCCCGGGSVAVAEHAHAARLDAGPRPPGAGAGASRRPARSREDEARLLWSAGQEAQRRHVGHVTGFRGHRAQCTRSDGRISVYGDWF
jgi:hypothetical protein